MNDYVIENGVVEEKDINDLLHKYASASSNLLAIYTTGFSCTSSSIIDDVKHALEVRLFYDTYEFKAVRATIGSKFIWRYIDDKKIDEQVLENISYDEDQYLDIDEKRTVGTSYVSIGGGTYEMPEAGLEKVRIRHYGEFDEDGMFALRDFRIVSFLKKEGNKNEQ